MKNLMMSLSLLLFCSAAESSDFRIRQYEGRVRINPNASQTQASLMLTQIQDYASTEAMLLQSDGKSLVASRVCDYSQCNQSRYEVTIVRYNRDGSLDESFGRDGIVSVQALLNRKNIAVNALAVQPDKKILAAGTSSNKGLVLRLNADGSLDETFGSDGVTEIEDTSSQASRPHVSFNFLVLAQERILVVGYSAVDDSVASGVILSALDSNGAVDIEFGEFGAAVLQAGEGIKLQTTSVSIDSKDRVVLAGTKRISGSSQAIVWRYSANGVLDSSFGQDGIVGLRFTNVTETYRTQIQSLADGGVLVTGTNAIDDNQFQTFVTKLRSNGATDTSFGKSGVSTAPGVWVSSLLTTLDGRILVGGTSSDFGQGINLMQFSSDGMLDTSFGNQGVMLFAGHDFDDDGIAQNIPMTARVKGIFMRREGDSELLVGGSMRSSRASTEIHFLLNISLER